MLVLMEQTINFMGTLNPEYTQEIVNDAQNEGRVVMMLDNFVKVLYYSSLNF